MLWRGRVLTILRWLEAFPPRAVASDARLSVVKAWVMSFLNRGAEARRALADALDAGFEGSLPDGASSLEASAALIRAGFAWDHVGEMLSAASRAFELEGNPESMWQVTAHVQFGFALYLSGRFGEARPLLERAAELAPLDEQWMNSFGSGALLARIALSSEDLPEAERRARQSVRVVEDHGATDNPQTSYAYTTFGAVLARKGDLVDADRVLTGGLQLQRGLGQPLLLAEALLDLAPVRRALGDSPAALALLEEARTLVEGSRDPGMLRDALGRVSRSLAPRQVNQGGRLSAREIEVLRLLARGLQNREIAAALFVTYNTIHSHIRSIYRKLGTSSRSEAIDRARSEGLL